MNKRYQVFLSSTFTDLEDERREVIQALLELDCIPSGMELFQASDDDQWTLIKRVIDQCDYYIVISAGRYGSVSGDGRSYTEMEYDYAVKVGKPVLGFLHKEPSKIAAKNCELAQEGREALKEFQEKIKQRVCRFWVSPSELGSQVSRSIIRVIRDSPAIGWVRADSIASEDASKEILDLRRQIDEFQKGMSDPEKLDTSEFAKGDEQYRVKYRFTVSENDFDFHAKLYAAEVSVSWSDLFAVVGPSLLDEASETQMAANLSLFVRSRQYASHIQTKAYEGKQITTFQIDPETFQTIKIQFRALGYIKQSVRRRSVKDSEKYWTLTEHGDIEMVKARAVPSSEVDNDA